MKSNLFCNKQDLLTLLPTISPDLHQDALVTLITGLEMANPCVSSVNRSNILLGFAGTYQTLHWC